MAVGIFLFAMEVKLFPIAGVNVCLFTGGIGLFIFAARKSVSVMAARQEARRKKRSAIYKAWLEFASLSHDGHIEMTDDLRALSDILLKSSCPLALKQDDIEISSVEEFAALCRQKREQWQYPYGSHF